MAHDLELAKRLEKLLGKRPGFQEKTFFGGIGWMLNGNFCTGIHKDWLVTRVGAEAALKLLKEPHVKVMDITGKAMKGWVMIAPQGVMDDSALRGHVELAIEFVQTLLKKN
jgi:hypothetical protein